MNYKSNESPQVSMIEYLNFRLKSDKCSRLSSCFLLTSFIILLKKIFLIPFDSIDFTLYDLLTRFILI